MNPVNVPTHKDTEDQNTVTATPANGNVQAFPFPTSESMAKARGEELPAAPAATVQTKKPLHERKRLTAVFNFAAGAAVTASAKIGTTMLLTSFAVPAVATLAKVGRSERVVLRQGRFSRLIASRAAAKAVLLRESSERALIRMRWGTVAEEALR